MATRVVPKTELRERIREELADLGDDDAVLITERGRPLAVVVYVERWNDLQETIEALEDALPVVEHRHSRAKARPAEQVVGSTLAPRGEVYR